MGEVKREVKTYEVNYVCDSCHQGFMKQTDSTPTAHVAISYAHTCDQCGYRQLLSQRYPQQRVE